MIRTSCFSRTCSLLLHPTNICCRYAVNPLATAHALFREAATTPATPVIHRLRASFNWCLLSRVLTPESALDAYVTAIELLDVALAQARSLHARHAHLSTDRMLPSSQLAELATDAASCAVDQGKLGLAVELLDQGRTTILTQVGRYRTQLDDVTAVDAELAKAYLRLSRQLDASVVRGDEMIEAPDMLRDTVARYVTPSNARSLSKHSFQLPQGCE